MGPGVRVPLHLQIVDRTQSVIHGSRRIFAASFRDLRMRIQLSSNRAAVTDLYIAISRITGRGAAADDFYQGILTMRSLAQMILQLRR